MKKILLALAALSLHATAAAQSSQQPPRSDLSYSYAELRFVDVDTSGGDGFRLAGSFDLDGPWILVGALTALDFNNNVDSTLLELGGGYPVDRRVYNRTLPLIGNAVTGPRLASSGRYFASSGSPKSSLRSQVLDADERNTSCGRFA